MSLKSVCVSVCRHVCCGGDLCVREECVHGRVCGSHVSERVVVTAHSRCAGVRYARVARQEGGAVNGGRAGCLGGCSAEGGSVYRRLSMWACWAKSELCHELMTSRFISLHKSLKLRLKTREGDQKQNSS